MTAKILVCSLSSADSDPRPNRVIRYLAEKHRVSFLGLDSTIHNDRFYPVSLKKSLFLKLLIFLGKLFRAHRLTEHWLCRLTEDIDCLQFDVVICHSPELFPLLIPRIGSVPLVFDAREFYPRHFENSFSWRMLDAPLQNYLCKRYLPRVDVGMTVSAGLAREYRKQFQVDFDVMYGLPQYQNLSPVKTGANIRLIYHGIATPARELERLIFAMDQVRPNILLDLMLMGHSKYTKKIIAMASARPNINVTDPVPYDDIVQRLHEYDVGVVFFPPSTFNLRHCMPNKLFEVIQARLAVLASPLVDISAFLNEYDVGLVSASFSPEALAETINHLSPELIDGFKSNSDRLAEKFSQRHNNDKLDKIIEHCLGDR